MSATVHDPVAAVHQRFPLVAFIDRTACLAFGVDGCVHVEATAYLRGLLSRGTP